ncbi:MAG: YfhO family protein [Candidatus Levybacteria bacterium]|nr:YfhO family protein [Candidatus Levybacteria bacterium]
MNDKFKKFALFFIPFLIIITLPIIFFGKASIGKDIILNGDFTGSDLLDLHLPFKAILKEAIESKSLPLWTSYLSNGFPIFAEGQTGIFYPPNLIFSILPSYLALTYSITLAFILAGIFTFIYCRSLFFSRFASLVSASTFMFSAFFVTRLKHINLIAVAAWTPFSFWAIRKFFQEKKLKYAVFLGIGFGLQFLAGHPQMAYYCLFISIIYFLFEFYQSIKKSGFAQTFPVAILGFFIAIVITVGISAVQTLPTLELTQQTERLEFSLQNATAYPFNPKNLLTFISPYYFGNPALGTYKEDIRLTGIFWENSSYIGLLPIVLVSLTVFIMIRRKKIEQYQIFFIALVIFSLLLMLGGSTPLFGILWQNIPGFQLFRFPTRFNLFLIFSLAILSGIGAEFLLKKLENLKVNPNPKNDEEFKFSWPLKKWQTQAIICGFIIIDLFVFGKNYAAGIDASLFLKKPKSVEIILKDKDLFRIWSTSQYLESPYQSLGWKTNINPLITIHEAIPPNSNVFYKIESFSDRGWFEGGLSLKRRNNLERYLMGQETDMFKLGKILGLSNVKYLLTFSEIQNSEFPLLKNIDLGKEFGIKLNIYKNSQVMPRVFYTPEAKVIPRENELFKELTSPSFYPVKTVLLEKNPKKVTYSFNGAVDDFGKKNKIKIESYKNNEVIIKTDFKDPGFLVLSDSFYPGWKAKIDGKEKEILSANYLFRAIEMEKGKHEVRFFYDPLSFKIGALISGSTLLIIIAYFLAKIMKYNYKHEENTKA